LNLSLSLSDADQNLDVVVKALEELKGWKILKVLELVLVAGNYLNSGGKNPKAAAVGFRVSSLLKVAAVLLSTVGRVYDMWIGVCCVCVVVYIGHMPLDIFSFSAAHRRRQPKDKDNSSQLPREGGPNYNSADLLFCV
jgi:hypothetical protein